MQRDALHAFSPPGPRESVASIARILFWQTIAGMVFASIAFMWAGSVAGSSALLGTTLCVVPNLVFALRIVPGMFQDSARQAMNGVYTAEALKLAATVLLFILVFRFVTPLRPDLLFGGFLVTQFSIILAALVNR
ncbi:MAG: ATP synthase subunit I [Gammaproteobacteria bacterium]|nr:ATP synthase subunit I [Gammaproteobacteria bacterium]